MKILVTEDAIYKGEIFEVNPMGCVIGRAEDCDIVLDTNGISRKHCQLLRMEGKWYIEDLESSNGVFLNQEKITEMTEVKNGDQIRLVDTFLTFDEDGEIEILQKNIIQNTVQEPIEQASVSVEHAPKKIFHRSMHPHVEKKNDIPVSENRQDKPSEEKIEGSSPFKEDCQVYWKSTKRLTPWFLFLIAVMVIAFQYVQRCLELKDLVFDSCITPTTPVEVQTAKDARQEKGDPVSNALLVLTLPNTCQVLLEDGVAATPMARTEIKGKFQIVRPGFLPIESTGKMREMPSFTPENHCVWLESIPNGAMVKLGSRLIGHTPCLIHGLAEGRYEITVGGNKTMAKRVGIEIKEQGQIMTVDLEPKSVALTFHSKEDCEFTITQTDPTDKSYTYVVKANEVLTLEGFQVGPAKIEATSTKLGNKKISLSVSANNNSMIELF